MKGPVFAVLTLVVILSALCPAPGLSGQPARPDSGGSPASSQPRVAPALPLLLDREDLGLGSTVLFTRVPNAADLNGLTYLASVMHVVLVLPEWPAGWEQLLPLQQSLLPEGADLVVVLPGYPPTRVAAEAWNFLRKPLRIVLVVDGPPADRGMILELNSIRALERVVADMTYPSRSGFERLQRPLSFRVVRR